MVNHLFFKKKPRFKFLSKYFEDFSCTFLYKKNKISNLKLLNWFYFTNKSFLYKDAGILTKLRYAEMHKKVHYRSTQKQYLRAKNLLQILFFIRYFTKRNSSFDNLLQKNRINLPYHDSLLFNFKRLRNELFLRSFLLANKKFFSKDVLSTIFKNPNFFLKILEFLSKDSKKLDSLSNTLNVYNDSKSVFSKKNLKVFFNKKLKIFFDAQLFNAFNFHKKAKNINNKINTTWTLSVFLSSFFIEKNLGFLLKRKFDYSYLRLLFFGGNFFRLHSKKVTKKNNWNFKKLASSFGYLSFAKRRKMRYLSFKKRKKAKRRLFNFRRKLKKRSGFKGKFSKIKRKFLLKVKFNSLKRYTKFLKIKSSEFSDKTLVRRKSKFFHSLKKRFKYKQKYLSKKRKKKLQFYLAEKQNKKRLKEEAFRNKKLNVQKKTLDVKNTKVKHKRKNKKQRFLFFYFTFNFVLKQKLKIASNFYLYSSFLYSKPLIKKKRKLFFLSKILVLKNNYILNTPYKKYFFKKFKSNRRFIKKNNSKRKLIYFRLKRQLYFYQYKRFLKNFYKLKKNLLKKHLKASNFLSFDSLKKKEKNLCFKLFTKHLKSDYFFFGKNVKFSFAFKKTKVPLYTKSSLFFNNSLSKIQFSFVNFLDFFFDKNTTKLDKNFYFNEKNLDTFFSKMRIKKKFSKIKSKFFSKNKNNSKIKNLKFKTYKQVFLFYKHDSSDFFSKYRVELKKKKSKYQKNIKKVKEASSYFHRSGLKNKDKEVLTSKLNELKAHVLDSKYKVKKLSKFLLKFNRLVSKREDKLFYFAKKNASSFFFRGNSKRFQFKVKNRLTLYKSKIYLINKFRYFLGGLRLKVLNRLVKKALSFRGKQNLYFFKLIESRIDVIFFRLGLFRSFGEIHQHILHGKILVNGKKVTFPGFCVKDSDIFSIDDSLKNEILLKNVIASNFGMLPICQIPEYIEFNFLTFSGIFLSSLVKETNVYYPIKGRLLMSGALDLKSLVRALQKY